MPQTIEGLDLPPVTLPAGTGRAETRLWRLKVAGRDVYMLVQRGSLKDCAYDHGRLLAAEIERGVFPEILSSIGRGTNLPNVLAGAAARLLFRALTDRVLQGVSAEFRDAVAALGQGYREGLPAPSFSQQQVTDALLAIEVEDLADGIARRVAIPSLAVKAKAIAEAVELCLETGGEEALKELFTNPVRAVEGSSTLGAALARMTHPASRSGIACTGFSVPGDLTRDRRHLHARNLDADLYHWNSAPTILLIDERPAGARHRYVAFGTAGLLYPGGISGINDAGIAASLHQLSTTQYRLRFDNDSADLAPFLQQRVLRDAGSLAEAIEIVQAAENISAWTIFCSDAKTGETVRMEFNGRDTRVGPIFKGAQSQTNHFLNPDLAERLFNAEDAHFTPTLGKWLETRTRMAMVDAALAEGAASKMIDVAWAIDLLSSGQDPGLSETAKQLRLDPAKVGIERAFGRVPRKAYGQFSTIVRGDPERRPGMDEAWLTVGDRLPGCQGTFVGWRIDWDGFDLQPVASEPVRRTSQYVATGRANWEVSFERYLAARVAVVRPQDAAGEILSHAADPAETQLANRRAEALLSEAIDLAAQDRIVEVPYYYMRARIRHELGDYEAASGDWAVLRSIWATQSGGPASPGLPDSKPRVQPILLDYEAALVLALAAVTEDKRLGTTAWPGRANQLQAASGLLADVRQRLFGDKPAHFDLLAWISRLSLLAGPHPEQVTLPEPNFVTAE